MTTLFETEKMEKEKDPLEDSPPRRKRKRKKKEKTAEEIKYEQRVK